MAWHLPAWKIPPYTSFALGSIETAASVFPMEVWVCGGGRQERGIWVREGERALIVLLCRKKNVLLDVKQFLRLWYKNHLFLRVPEEGMISYSWLFDEHINFLAKFPSDFMNGEVILWFSLSLGFTYGVSLNNGLKKTKNKKTKP